MAGTALPEYPLETEFEEFVSAYLHTGGAYVERQIHEKEERDILELDLVLTTHHSSGLTTRIAEVKSGDWGCGDLFKLSGWMRYLEVEGAALAALGESKDRGLLDFVAARLGIDLAWIGTHEEAAQALSPLVDGAQIDELDVLIWRYSYWLDRCLEQRLNDLRKCGDGRQGPKSTYAVHRTLQTNLFARDMLTRTDALYDTFRNEPHLSARWGAEIQGGDFANDPGAVPAPVFADVYYNNVAVPHDLDLVTWVEHRMRIAILKNLVDYELLRRQKGDAFEHVMVRFLGREFRLVDMLPESFKTALDALSSHPYLHRYPVLWQWFLWFGGGFLLLDYLDREYEWLGSKANIPPEAVPAALEAYETLFPAPNGWFRTLEPQSRIKVIALMPVPYYGIGANYRRLLYAEDQTYDGLTLTGPYTRSDLGKWNNNLIAYLQRCR